ncbi:MAG: alkyl hydroperoxide reductase subunit C [Tissierellia bacterium]|nr:alkyl hydroperoxide reductase subunit C [Tissierellia bacterium]
MNNFIGKKLDEFKVPVYHDGVFSEVTEKDLDGKWSVLFFYPGDFTFVCPTELEDLANHYEKFKEIGAEIYSVSTDSEFVHKAWKDKSEAIKKVEYPMISDRTFVLSNMLGVLIPEEGQALRGTFVINPDREIMAYEIHALGIGRDAKELLRKVEAAQFVYKNGDKVCPAAWHPGDDTLTPGIDLVGEI